MTSPIGSSPIGTSLAELPFPLFDAIDNALAVALPPVVRLVVWGVVAGSVAMLLYALCSSQARIREQKALIASIQSRLKAAKDDFALTMRLSRANLGASFKLLGMVTGPAVLSSLPVAFLLVWVAETFAYAVPAPGTAVPMALTPPTPGLSVGPPGAFHPAVGHPAAGHPAAASPDPAPAAAAAKAVTGTLAWPAAGELSVADAQGPAWSHPVAGKRPPVVVKKAVWWNWLYGNPAGYLRAGADLQEIDLAVPPLEVVGAGPSWLRGWEVVFFASTIVASLVVKRLARID